MDLSKAKIDMIDIGNDVLCDLCNKDYTDDNTTTGGFTFGSKAVCPACAPEFEKNVKKHKEEWNIKERCPEGKSFRDWVLQDLRKGDNTITTYSW